MFHSTKALHTLSFLSNNNFKNQLPSLCVLCIFVELLAADKSVKSFNLLYTNTPT